MATTILLTYSGTAKDRFDREYYCSIHMPQVEATWKPFGLLSAKVFFPATQQEDQLGTVAICECVFKDEAAVETAFSSPRTAELVADLVNFTDLSLSRSRMEAYPI